MPFKKYPLLIIFLYFMVFTLTKNKFFFATSPLYPSALPDALVCFPFLLPRAVSV